MGLASRLLSIASIALLYLLGVQSLNFFSLKKLGRFPKKEDYPFVSILVPARNEERNIEKCIKSLLQQNYPNYEIIVLDDESEDRTWQILSRLAQGNDNLHLLKGKPLPEGWIGKCWACHQLSEKARGEFLLLVDADTFHKPSMLHSVMDTARFYQADLISGLPMKSGNLQRTTDHSFNFLGNSCRIAAAARLCPAPSRPFYHHRAVTPL